MIVAALLAQMKLALGNDSNGRARLVNDTVFFLCSVNSWFLPSFTATTSGVSLSCRLFMALQAATMTLLLITSQTDVARSEPTGLLRRCRYLRDDSVWILYNAWDERARGPRCGWDYDPDDDNPVAVAADATRAFWPERKKDWARLAYAMRC